MSVAHANYFFHGNIPPTLIAFLVYYNLVWFKHGSISYVHLNQGVQTNDVYKTHVQPSIPKFTFVALLDCVACLQA